MSTKLVKILQRESGPFNVSNNLLSIDMEPGATDLSKSYIHMEVAFTKDGLVPNDTYVRLGNYDTNSSYSTSACVKHASLRSDVVGLVEQQRFINVWNQTTRQFMESTEAKLASVSFGNNEVQLDSNGVGHMLIPLDKLLGAAKSEQLYPARMGQSRIELELEDKAQWAYFNDTNPLGRFTLNCNDIDNVDSIQQVTLTQPMSPTSVSKYFVSGRNYTLSYLDGTQQEETVTIANIQYNDTTNIVTLIFDGFIDLSGVVDVTDITISSINQADDGTYEIENVDNATAATVLNNTWIVQDALASSFVQGYTIQLGFLVQTLAGLAPTDTYDNLIAQIDNAVQTGDNVTLTTSVQYPIPANKGLREVFVFGPDSGTLDWSVPKVELIQAMPLNAKDSQFEFKTLLLENVNHPAGVNQFRRQVQLESGVDLVTMINPVTDPLLGSNQFDTYRNSINSVDTITKDVSIDYNNNGSIYFDRLMYAFPDLKKLQPLNGSVVVSMVPEKIEPEQALEPENTVEFRLQHTVGVPVNSGMLYFYKRIAKVF